MVSNKWTAVKLLASSADLAKWRQTGYSNSKNITLVKVLPFKGVNTLVFVFDHLSSGKENKQGVSKNTWRTYIEFQDVLFYDHVNTDKKTAKLEYQGDVYYYRKPSISDNPVRVKCSCNDYRFRFEYPNYKVGILYGGKPRAYKRKTPPPPQGRPYANPESLPGYCKHIFNSIQRMQTLNYII